MTYAEVRDEVCRLVRFSGMTLVLTPSPRVLQAPLLVSSTAAQLPLLLTYACRLCAGKLDEVSRGAEGRCSGHLHGHDVRAAQCGPPYPYC